MDRSFWYLLACKALAGLGHPSLNTGSCSECFVSSLQRCWDSIPTNQKLGPPPKTQNEAFSIRKAPPTWPRQPWLVPPRSRKRLRPQFAGSACLFRGRPVDRGEVLGSVCSGWCWGRSAPRSESSGEPEELMYPFEPSAD